MIPKVDFPAVKRLIPITAALAVMGYRLPRRRGRSLLGPCPLHSLPSSQSTAFRCSGLVWYCERCQRGGDVVRLWGLHHHLTDLEAALELCDLFDLQVPRL
jgi:hypothetical protein